MYGPAPSFTAENLRNIHDLAPYPSCPSCFSSPLCVPQPLSGSARSLPLSSAPARHTAHRRRAMSASSSDTPSPVGTPPAPASGSACRADAPTSRLLPRPRLKLHTVPADRCSEGVRPHPLIRGLVAGWFTFPVGHTSRVRKYPYDHWPYNPQSVSLCRTRFSAISAAHAVPICAMSRFT